MMRSVSLIVLALAVFVLPSCGNKGKLKSPAQIEQINAKKAHKAAKESEDNAAPETSPMPASIPTPTPN